MKCRTQYQSGSGQSSGKPDQNRHKSKAACQPQRKETRSIKVDHTRIQPVQRGRTQSVAKVQTEMKNSSLVEAQGPCRGQREESGT